MLSRQIKRSDFDNIRLTIYYMSPFLLTLVPISTDSLSTGGFADKIVVDGEILEKHIDLINQMIDADLIPIKPQTYVNARIYYKFETHGGKNLFDVAMWGFDDNLFVNGVEVEENDIFYDVIMPFLPDTIKNELKAYIEYEIYGYQNIQDDNGGL